MILTTLHMTVFMGDDAIDIWPFALGILLLLLLILALRKRSFSYLFCAAVFGVYLLFALDKTFFPLWLSGGYAEARRQQPFAFADYVNLVPFYFGPYGTLSDTLPELLLNVALTIPFGFGLSFVLRFRGKTFLWLAPVLCLGIELIQLVMSLLLRYPYRYADIDDVIMNTLGMWIGYGVFRVFAWLYVRLTQRFAIRHRGLTAYVYQVASQVG